MDWLRRLNEAIRYIEDNLDGTIDYAQAAQKACCSAYHFQRDVFLHGGGAAVGIHPQPAAPPGPQSICRTAETR